MKSKKAFLDSLKKEIELQKGYLESERIETLYFGGGTPSIMEKEDFEDILVQLKNHFSFSKDFEFTIEANPDDLDEETLKSLKKIGGNRLSIGIQSFNDKYLKFFNRAHNSTLAESCIPLARSIGFDNISMDLIFGSPNQSIEELETDLQKSIGMTPDHISIYGLTIEEKTVFGNWHKKGKITPLEEEIAAKQFELILERLGESGYEQYEISNFSKPGFESRHNSSYWSGKKYLGLGPSAHSFNGQSRQYNVPNNAQYIRALQNSKIPSTVEILSLLDQTNDTILTRMRTSAGLDTNWLLSKFDINLMEEKESEISQFIGQGMLENKQGVLTLTPAGKLLADLIIEKLII